MVKGRGPDIAEIPLYSGELELAVPAGIEVRRGAVPGWSSERAVWCFRNINRSSGNYGKAFSVIELEAGVEARLAALL